MAASQPLRTTSCRGVRKAGLRKTALRRRDGRITCSLRGGASPAAGDGASCRQEGVPAAKVPRGPAICRRPLQRPLRRRPRLHGDGPRGTEPLCVVDGSEKWFSGLALCSNVAPCTIFYVDI
ncbi:uncharacterized protein LOC144316130 [Canis aureus]